MWTVESVNKSDFLENTISAIQYSSRPLKISIFNRFFDILFSLMVFICFGWLYLLLALTVKLSSKGSVIYTQERIGQNGKPFSIYKFRTMYNDAEKSGPALSGLNDPRVTNTGKILRKLHLDELPQFYNVLRGEMSIIGTRPEREYFIRQILERAPCYKQILTNKPGITSWGQLRYGYAQNVDEMIERLNYDIFYVENRSTKLDLKIFFFTIMLMLSGKNKWF